MSEPTSLLVCVDRLHPDEWGKLSLQINDIGAGFREENDLLDAKRGPGNVTPRGAFCTSPQMPRGSCPVTWPHLMLSHVRAHLPGQCSEYTALTSHITD